MQTLEILPPATKIWVVIDPVELERQWHHVSPETRKGLSDTGKPVMYEDVTLSFVFFPIKKMFGLGILVHEFPTETPFKVAEFVSDCSSARADVIWALKGLGLKKFEEHVGLFLL